MDLNKTLEYLTWLLGDGFISWPSIPTSAITLNCYFRMVIFKNKGWLSRLGVCISGHRVHFVSNLEFSIRFLSLPIRFILIDLPPRTLHQIEIVILVD